MCGTSVCSSLFEADSLIVFDPKKSELAAECESSWQFAVLYSKPMHLLNFIPYTLNRQLVVNLADSLQFAIRKGLNNDQHKTIFRIGSWVWTWFTVCRSLFEADSLIELHQKIWIGNWLWTWLTFRGLLFKADSLIQLHQKKLNRQLVVSLADSLQLAICKGLNKDEHKIIF